MEREKPGRSSRWLKCCLSEPRDMVHPGPDSSDGCASQAPTEPLKASTYSQPVRLDAAQQGRLLEYRTRRDPACASGWSLVKTGGWMPPTESFHQWLAEELC